MRMGNDRGWISIEASSLTVSQLERCAEHLEAAWSDPYRLLDAIRTMHLAMVASLTEALSGSAGVGALEERYAVRALAALNAGEPPPMTERVMHYGALLEAAQERGRLPWSDQPLVLTDDESRACAALEGDRHLIEHPKPTTWSLATADLRWIVVTVAPVVLRLIDAVSHHYLDNRDQAVRAIDRIKAQATAPTPDAPSGGSPRPLSDDAPRPVAPRSAEP